MGQRKYVKKQIASFLGVSVFVEVQGLGAPFHPHQRLLRVVNDPPDGQGIIVSEMNKILIQLLEDVGIEQERLD